MVALLMPLRGDDDYDDDDGDDGQLVVNQIRPVQRVPIKCLWATKGVLAVTFIFINVIIIINIILSSSSSSTSASSYNQHCQLKSYFT